MRDFLSHLPFGAIAGGFIGLMVAAVAPAIGDGLLDLYGQIFGDYALAHLTYTLEPYRGDVLPFAVGVGAAVAVMVAARGDAE